MREFDGLELDRCRLVPFSEAHLTDRYVAWLNDPEVVRFSEQRHRHHDRQSCRAYFDAVAGSGDLFIAIETDVQHVGNITVAIDRPNSSADVSIMIGEAEARGVGIASRAWCAMIDWLLGPGGVRRVSAGTMECNLPMIALMKKSGMTIEVVRPRVFVLEGEEVGCVLAARFARKTSLTDEGTR